MPILEHWASEHDFRMVAMKGKRRLYQRGHRSSPYIVFVDFKQRESEISVTAWIHVSLTMRLLSLLLLPVELLVEPSGWLAAIQRRKVCHEMNVLLDRYRQPPIFGSRGFHLADIDITTLGMMVLMTLPIFFYLFSASSQIEVRSGLFNELLAAVGRHFGVLVSAGGGILALHQFVVVRTLPQLLWKNVSVFVGAGIFFLVSLSLLTRTSQDVTHGKITHFCVQQFDRVNCNQALDRLTPEERDQVRLRLRQIDKELSLRPR